MYLSRNVIKIEQLPHIINKSSAQGKDKRVYNIKPVTQDDTLDQNISFHRILYFLLSYFVLFFSNIIYSIFIKYIYIYIFVIKININNYLKILIFWLEITKKKKT